MSFKLFRPPKPKPPPKMEDWLDKGVKIIQGASWPVALTGEQWRAYCLSHNLPHPGHHNWWGVLVKRAVQLNLLRDYLHDVARELPQSHGSLTRTWERTRRK